MKAIKFSFQRMTETDLNHFPEQISSSTKQRMIRSTLWRPCLKKEKIIMKNLN